MKTCGDATKSATFFKHSISHKSRLPSISTVVKLKQLSVKDLLRGANFSLRCCVNPDFCLPLAASASFTDPLRDKYAPQSSYDATSFFWGLTFNYQSAYPEKLSKIDYEDFVEMSSLSLPLSLCLSSFILWEKMRKCLWQLEVEMLASSHSAVLLLALFRLLRTYSYPGSTETEGPPLPLPYAVMRSWCNRNKGLGFEVVDKPFGHMNLFP